MLATNRPEGAAESGLAALVLLLRFHGIGADTEQIRHRFAGANRRPRNDPLRQRIRPKGAKFSDQVGERLSKTPLPGIAVLRDSRFLLLGKASEDRFIVQDPLSSRPVLMSREEIEAIWDGRLVLMAGRAGLGRFVTRHFGISWFVGAIHKYRHILGEVLVASFFLQLFALVSPLFFQVDNRQGAGQAAL